MKKSEEILKEKWGYDQFRPLQGEIVESVIYGHDTFAILPTGGGKSICYQIPGLALEGLTIVVSPLIALMEDQVSNLRSKGIQALQISSSMSYREIDIALDNARFGKIDFLYTSPERIKSPLFVERLKSMPVSLIVVDEAHCISEWGHEFRPAYRDIADIREIHPNVPIIAVTASATKQVEDDIIRQLQLRKPNIFKGSLRRENLSYKVIATENKLKKVLEFCKNNQEHTGIVYCQTRRSVKEIVVQLRSSNVSAGFYHGGLSPEDRNYMLDHWMKGKLKVMVATNAFGMGIDKPDVRYVLHYEIPGSLEALYQECGRAGRDEKEAQTIAFWEQKDLDHLVKQINQRFPDSEIVKSVYNQLCNYLKIAIGSGNQESYEIDIQDFCKKFNVPISSAYYSLKILELNGNLNFNERNFHPTRLKFAIGNSALYKFQVAHESVASLITLLTRSYPGIFDRFISLNESEFSKRLKLDKVGLRKKLEFLEEYGVVDITYQSHLPIITLLQERLPDNYLSINNSIYTNRKKVEKSKVDSVISYIKSTNCRSASIEAYFGVENTSDCGKCDNCRAKKFNNYEIDELTSIIPDHLPSTVEKLSNLLECPIDSVQKALHLLLLEEKIKYSGDIYETV